MKKSLETFFNLKESHTLVFSLEAWQNTSKTFPIEPFRNMSRAHNEAKLLFLLSRKVYAMLMHCSVALTIKEIFPVEPFRNMSRAHNEAKLLFLLK